MARRIASVASRILNRSISPTSADPIPTPRACQELRHTIGLAFLRKLLGIIDPKSRHRVGKTTAAATTGPANGPRPASSIPAIRRYPRSRAVARTRWVSYIPSPSPSHCRKGTQTWKQSRPSQPPQKLSVVPRLLSPTNSRSSTFANLPFCRADNELCAPNAPLPNYINFETMECQENPFNPDPYESFRTVNVSVFKLPLRAITVPS